MAETNVGAHLIILAAACTVKQLKPAEQVGVTLHYMYNYIQNKVTYVMYNFFAICSVQYV